MLPIRLSKPILLMLTLGCCVSCDSDDDGNRVLIGNSAELFEIGELQYQEEFAVQVTDPDGAPAPSSFVTLRLTPLSYNKGLYIQRDIDFDGTVDQWVPDVTAVCASEDTNDNGALDAGEDANGNGFLDPDVPTLTAHPTLTPTVQPGSNILVTDADGFGYFAVTYPKSEGAWSSVLVTAEVSDDLPGNIAAYTLDLGVLLEDISNLTVSPPGGGTSPYGTATNCTNPN